MYAYVSQLISACAGCKMANSYRRKNSEIIYSFPTDAPMKIVHADVYTVGADLDFSGHKNFMFIVDGLSTFAMWEPLKECNSTSFAEAIMKMLLTHGLCHTIVVDKDTKFRSI